MKHWKLGVIAALMSGAVYAAPMNVVTSFSILGDVTKQIGGDRVAVQNLVGANQDSHAYHMTSGDIKKIRGAKLVLLNGLGLEAADVQRAVKQSKVPFAEATKGIQALKAEEGGHHHDHDHEHHHHHSHSHHSGINSFVIETEKPLVLANINEWLNELVYIYGPELYRYKGILNVEGLDYQIIFQGVQMSFDISRGRDWKDTKRGSTLVFIGKNLPENQLRESFIACTEK